MFAAGIATRGLPAGFSSRYYGFNQFICYMVQLGQSVICGRHL